jgi:hypothetical protein
MEEIWKDSLIGNYQVSNLGRIKAMGERKVILKPRQRYDGYQQVSIFVDGRHKMYLVHRLIAMAFIPNPLNLPMINHIDAVRNNNVVYNLEWCDRSYNTKHSFKLGLQNNKGVNNPNYKHGKHLKYK